MSGFHLAPGGVLLLGVLCFVLSWAQLAALALAALVHELGHLLALRLAGARLYGVSLLMTGPVIRCEAPQSRMGQALVSLSGPAAGLLLWLALRSLWIPAAELSLLLSLLNLLPILPLDGGRALFALLGGGDLAARALRYFGVMLSLAIAAAGLLAAGAGYGVTLAVFGAWLLILSCQGGENDVK